MECVWTKLVVSDIFGQVFRSNYTILFDRLEKFVKNESGHPKGQKKSNIEKIILINFFKKSFSY